MPSPARAMLGGDVLEEGACKESPGEGPRAQDKFLDERPERSLKPSAYGHGKPHLSAREDLSWNHIAQRPPQPGLVAPALELEVGRDGDDVFAQLVVQIGDPTLDRRRHAHPILGCRSKAVLREALRDVI